MTSYMRIKSRSVNKSVYQQNRLVNFLMPPVRYGNLYVENNQLIGNDLDICGNLTIDGDLKARNYYANGNYYLNNYVLIPAGTIIQSASVNEPDGWFNCDGRLLTVSSYQNLFNAILYTYGGSGPSFNIPDMRGRTAIGLGQGNGLSNRTLGSQGGEESHVLSVGEMPSHSHTSNAIGGTIGLITSDGLNTAAGGVDNSTGEPNLYASIQALTINNTGSSNAHNNMQPYIVLRYLIKY